MKKLTSLRRRRFEDDPKDEEDRREEILRQEMNNIATRGHKHFQWSVTLLITLETALFFVRKEAAERAGFLPGEPFPLERHLWGTIMITFITLLLITIARAIYRSYEYYYDQLPQVLSSGVKRVPRRKVKSLIWVTLLLFPISDLLIGLGNGHLPLQHDPSYIPPEGSLVTNKVSQRFKTPIADDNSRASENPKTAQEQNNR